MLCHVVWRCVRGRAGGLLQAAADGFRSVPRSGSWSTGGDSPSSMPLQGRWSFPGRGVSVLPGLPGPNSPPWGCRASSNTGATAPGPGEARKEPCAGAGVAGRAGDACVPALGLCFQQLFV